jgi:broad specificity phosphatase PhoE
MPPTTTRVLLIRHGQSSANADGRLQGRLDFSLSERGRRESELLAGRLAGLTIAAHPGETVAVVTHGGVISGACRQAIGLERKRPGPFSIENTSVTMLEVRNGATPPQASLAGLNDVCHLNGLA